MAAKFALRGWCALFAAAVLLTVAAPAQAVGREGKITAADSEDGDRFGWAVAISGETMVVGAAESDGGRGAAYVFTRGRNGWVESARLTASDGSEGDWFGFAVAIFTDTIVVGAARDDDAGASSGAAYVFARTRGGWIESAKLTASDAEAGDSFGAAVDVSDDVIVVGAPGRASPDGFYYAAGRAYVFARAGGNRWVEAARLKVEDVAWYHEAFGSSVAVDGGTVAVGASGRGVSYPWVGEGAVYVFEEAPTGWQETAMVTASNGDWFDYFGDAVALEGDTLVVGAWHGRQAYVFARDGDGWTEVAVLSASDAELDLNYFGSSVAVASQRVLVGAPLKGDDSSGGAYLYTVVDDQWVEYRTLTAGDASAGDAFGWSVALTPDTVAVGSDGAAYVYTP